MLTMLLVVFSGISTPIWSGDDELLDQTCLSEDVQSKEMSNTDLTKVCDDILKITRNKTTEILPTEHESHEVEYKSADHLLCVTELSEVSKNGSHVFVTSSSMSIVAGVFKGLLLKLCDENSRLTTYNVDGSFVNLDQGWFVVVIEKEGYRHSIEMSAAISDENSDAVYGMEIQSGEQKWHNLTYWPTSIGSISDDLTYWDLDMRALRVKHHEED